MRFNYGLLITVLSLHLLLSLITSPLTLGLRALSNYAPEYFTSQGITGTLPTGTYNNFLVCQNNFAYLNHISARYINSGISHKLFTSFLTYNNRSICHYSSTLEKTSLVCIEKRWSVPNSFSNNIFAESNISLAKCF